MLKSESNPTRRSLLRAGVAALAGPAAGMQAPPKPAQALYAYVGCYTTAKRYARGDVRADSASGRLTQTEHEVRNASPVTIAFAAFGD